MERIDAIAPDVGTLFEYGRNGIGTGPASFRVTAWMRCPPWRASPYEMAMAGALADEAGGRRAVFASEVVADILSDEESPSPRRRLEFCPRELATHVCGSGVAGCIAPIAELRVTGMVAWSAELLADERAHAQALGLKGEALC